MNDRELSIIKELYLTSWDEAISASFSLFDAYEARSLVGIFSKSRGWRERVVAAKIIVAFELEESIEALLSTFEENPEHYTCQAFTEMILRSKLNAKASYLMAMHEKCTNDEYGKHLKSNINEAIERARV